MAVTASYMARKLQHIANVMVRLEPAEKRELYRLAKADGIPAAIIARNLITGWLAWRSQQKES